MRHRQTKAAVDRHNAAVETIMKETILPMLKASLDPLEPVILLESLLLGVLLAGERSWKIPREQSAETVEVVAARVLERLAGIKHGGGE